MGQRPLARLPDGRDVSFARQFKAATGLPPYQFVIARRVERAKELLQSGGDLPLAEVAACAGFSDQSQFSRHFKRLVGVTPRQFRTPARIEKKAARPSKNWESDPLTIPHEEGESPWSPRWRGLIDGRIRFREQVNLSFPC